MINLVALCEEGSHPQSLLSFNLYPESSQTMREEYDAEEEGTLIKIIQDHRLRDAPHGRDLGEGGAWSSGPLLSCRGRC